MRYTVLALLVAVILVGCSPPPDSWPAEVHGVEIHYQRSNTDPYLALASPRAGWCLIRVSDELSNSGRFYVRGGLAITIVAHEVAHCLDWFLLYSTHNGFTNGDCGQPYCTAEEAYATAYAAAYIDACGYNGYPLGWSDEGDPCEPPAPRSVIPDNP